MVLKRTMAGVGRLLDKLKGLFKTAQDEARASNNSRGPTYRVAYSARLNMSPQLTTDDKHNGLLLNAELVGELSAIASMVAGAGVPSTDFKNLVGGETGRRNFFAAGLPFLGDHIIGVVLDRTQKQVVGINASGVVTAVADQKSIENRPVVNFPGETGSSVGFVTDSETAAAELPTRPQPTLAERRMLGPLLVDFFPKPPFNRGGFANGDEAALDLGIQTQSRHGATPLVALIGNSRQAGEVPALR